MTKYMISLAEIRANISQLINLVQEKDQTSIKLNSNGGNSILLITPPESEIDFITEIKNQLSNNNDFRIIDLNILFVSYVGKNKVVLLKKLETLQSSIYQVFTEPWGKENDDFFSLIIKEINDSFDSNRIPVLINVGTLYATRIDNIRIIEHKSVLDSKIPLIILYPATEQGDKLLFLNSRPASKYRCMIIK